MNKKVMTGIFALTAIFALSSSLNAQQEKNISGTYSIQADGETEAKGSFLHIWTHGHVITSTSYANTEFEIAHVGHDDREHVDAGLYSIKQKNGKYLAAKDGKIVVSDTPRKWIVWKNSNGMYSICWYEDDTQGANCISLVSNDYGKTVEKPNDGRYAIALARNNAEGKGMQHQLWKLTKKGDAAGTVTSGD